MKIDIVSKNGLIILFGIGGLLHAFGYQLEDITIRNESMYWISMVVPSTLGAIYLIMKWRLLRNKSYRKIKGIKLQLLKAVLCFFTLLASMGMFGGYLNFFVLGSNYLVTSEEKVESFNILEIVSSRPGLHRKTSTRIPLIRFSNGKLRDQLKLGDVSFEDFNKDVSKIEILSARGLWGLYVIKSIDFH
jgi:hypothetical protein